MQFSSMRDRRSEPYRAMYNLANLQVDGWFGLEVDKLRELHLYKRAIADGNERKAM